MKKINLLMLTVGFSVISACASNEATMKTDTNEMKTANKQADVAVVEEVKKEMKAESQPAETDAVIDTSDTLTATCEKDSQTRIITVVNNNEITEKICEVNYEKTTGTTTLWSANHDKNYCLDKAAAFVAKQEGWGWTCSSLK